MNLFNIKADGSYDYVSVDNGLVYYHDLDDYLTMINSNN